MRTFLVERLADGHAWIFGARALSAVAPAPGLGLRVQVIDVRPWASGEEVFSKVTNTSFNAAFFIAARRRNRAWFEVVVGGQAEQRGIKLRVSS